MVRLPLINVKVRYLVNFSIITGKKIEEVQFPEGATVKDLVDQLIKKYGSALKSELVDPKTDEIKRNVMILVNGRSIDQYNNGLTLTLTEGDLVIFTFPVTGG